MRAARLIAPLLLALVALPAQADPIAAHGEQEDMRRQDHERREIARILAADNLDAGRLSAREVADTIGRTPRGGAPEDFWTAYRAHFQAWERSASVEERLEALLAAGKPPPAEEMLGELLGAQLAVEETFAAVGRIAAVYGVPMPTPPAEVADTV